MLGYALWVFCHHHHWCWGVMGRAVQEVGMVVFGSGTFTMTVMLHFQKYQRSQNLHCIISLALTLTI